MYDFIIVGQGIAGTVLAHTFLKKNKSILLVDQELPDSPSAVAAGIYNPITGKRMVKTWMAEALFPFLEEFYGDLENELNCRFLLKLPIHKPFGSIAEQNFLIAENNGGDFSRLSDRTNEYSKFIFNSFGGFDTVSSGFVDVKKFIAASRSYFIQLGIIVPERFNYNDLVVNSDHVTWKNSVAKQVIFCEGPRNSENPFFNWLPFVLTKGEILEVSIQNFPNDVIFNKGVFVLPSGNGQYKVGATYDWNFTDNEITEEARHQISVKLEELLRGSYTISGQKSGIRPTVKDRRPLIGFHPQFKPLGIFNGLGTKGISLAPYFAQHFYEHIAEQKDLAPEVNIRRFYSLL